MDERATSPAASQYAVDDLGDADAVGRLVIRARRRADVSQRELAALVSVAPATIARIETGRGLPSLPVLSRILGIGGLRLVAIAPDGAPATPVPRAGVRDNGGRRFPAHLDVDPPDRLPREAIDRPRYDRPPARGWYHLRPERDRLIDGRATKERPQDHPTEDELALRKRLMRGRQPRVDNPPRPEVPCQCPDACFEEWCVPECPCRCEVPTLLQVALRQRQVPDGDRGR
jgi:HTH-type transcriptional regulator/antitoxin HipB